MQRRTNRHGQRQAQTSAQCLRLRERRALGGLAAAAGGFVLGRLGVLLVDELVTPLPSQFTRSIAATVGASNVTGARQVRATRAEPAADP